MSSENSQNALCRDSGGASINQNRFFAKMSYEMRTLLNAIIGFSQLLEYESLSDETKEYVGSIHQASQTLASLVDESFELLKIDSGQIRPSEREIALSELFSWLSSAVRLYADEKKTEFEIVQQTSLPEVIRTDVVCLRQCLTYLAKSIIAGSDGGSVKVNTSFDNYDSNASIRFDFEDNGTGLPLQRPQDLFEPFFGVTENTQYQTARSSLGLAIARRLAKLLGGELSFDDTRSVFSLIIPAGVSIDAQTPMTTVNIEQAPAEESAGSETAQCRGKILLVEDEPANQTVMTLLLEMLGLEVQTASDGREAVVAGQKGGIDLILMDIQMPNMNGFEATKELRRLGIETPIIALTAQDVEKNGQNFVEAGCNGYLSKPIESKKLQQMIKKHLHSSVLG